MKTILIIACALMLAGCSQVMVNKTVLVNEKVVEEYEVKINWIGIDLQWDEFWYRDIFKAKNFQAKTDDVQVITPAVIISTESEDSK